MVKKTYGQMKSEIVRIGGVTGFNITDPRVKARFNHATQILMNEGDWPGVVDRYLFSVTDGNIVLPHFLDRILGVAINGLPYSQRNAWFEFVEYGPGYNNGVDWLETVIDRDEQPVTNRLPVGTGWTLYTVGEVDETIDTVRPYLTVMGRKTNARDVRSFYVGTGYIDGERLDINGDTPNYTYVGTGLFETITSVVKPVTNGYVELWATSGTDTRQLATFAPKETNPSFHAYYLPTFKLRNSDGIESVFVRARKRFYDVVDDDDLVIIGNVEAMKHMLMAINKSEASDLEGYMGYKTMAVDILKKEALAYRGKAKTPAITFQQGAVIGDYPYVR